MKKKNITDAIIPTETFFYTVTFENPDQCLTMEMLSHHYPTPKGTKPDIGNRIAFRSYDHGPVSIRGAMLNILRTIFSLFQFQDGAIKSLRTFKNKAFAFLIFQFQDGAIKRCLLVTTLTTKQEFQFQDGAIKSF
jgi:hypothetical protein